MPLSMGHKKNFNTIRRAFRAGDAALMECQLATTGETAAGRRRRRGTALEAHCPRNQFGLSDDPIYATDDGPGPCHKTVGLWDQRRAED
jgi:hypothetical protein